MKRDLLRLTAAEFLGTFALVFVGCSTRAMVGETTNFAGILIVHIAFAFTIAAMIYTLSHISAAVFN
ncbi:MAG: aquaporin, partial [Chloroflexi bacterium]